MLINAAHRLRTHAQYTYTPENCVKEFSKALGRSEKVKEEQGGFVAAWDFGSFHFVLTAMPSQVGCDLKIKDLDGKTIYECSIMEHNYTAFKNAFHDKLKEAVSILRPMKTTVDAQLGMLNNLYKV